MAIPSMTRWHRRLSVVQQASRDIRYKVGGLESGRLAIEVHGPGGIETRCREVIENLPALLAMKGVEVRAYTSLGLELDVKSLVGKTAAQIDKMATKIDQLSQVAIARPLEIKLPEMVRISERLSIMKSEVTVGLFKEVMEGYEITGFGAEELQVILDDPSKTAEVLTHVNLYDDREFANRLSYKTGRRFRVPIEEEVEAVQDQLSVEGNNVAWTETPSGIKYFILRGTGKNARAGTFPEDRGSRYVILLAEDIVA